MEEVRNLEEQMRLLLHPQDNHLASHLDGHFGSQDNEHVSPVHLELPQIQQENHSISEYVIQQDNVVIQQEPHWEMDLESYHSYVERLDPQLQSPLEGHVPPEPLVDSRGYISQSQPDVYNKLESELQSKVDAMLEVEHQRLNFEREAIFSRINHMIFDARNEMTNEMKPVPSQRPIGSHSYGITRPIGRGFSPIPKREKREKRESYPHSIAPGIEESRSSTSLRMAKERWKKLMVQRKSNGYCINAVLSQVRLDPRDRIRHENSQQKHARDEDAPHAPQEHVQQEHVQQDEWRRRFSDLVAMRRYEAELSERNAQSVQTCLSGCAAPESSARLRRNERDQDTSLQGRALNDAMLKYLFR